MIRRADLSRARQVLLEEGYECALDDSLSNEASDEAFHVFVKRSRAATVDLQWVMADGTFAFRLDRARFWKRLRPMALAGTSVPVLAPEDLLLVLCVHGSKHVFEQLKWVCDIAELVRRHPGLDWTYLEKTARELHCWRMVLMGLALVRILLSAPLPDAIDQAIVADTEVPALARRMPQNLLSDPGYGLGEREREVFLFAIKDSRWEQWRHGLCLCRDHSPSLTVRYSWCPAWKQLQGVSAVIHPIRLLLRRVVPSVDLRRRMARWLMPAR